MGGTGEILKRSQAHLQALFNNPLQAFLVVDGRRRILAFNPAAQTHLRALSGRELQEGDAIDGFLGEDDRERVALHVERALAGESVAEERQFRASGGARLWLELSFSPIHAEGADEGGA